MFFRRRLLAFALVLATGLLLLASLLAGTAVTAIATYVGESLPVPPLLLEAAQFLVSLAIITVLFGILYKFLPDVKIAWADVWAGAGVTALLFTIGKTLLSLYLARSTVGSAYGAAGSLVLLLIWIYYSIQIFFLGAEFTQVNARRRGRAIEPRPHAVRFSRTYHIEA
jgi:membrane protein